MSTATLNSKEKVIENIKNIIRKSWLIRLLIFPFLRPKRFMDEFVYCFKDYLKFKKTTKKFRKYLDSNIPQDSTSSTNKSGLLVVAGKAMNVQWCQLWSTLASVYRTKNYHPYVLTSYNQPLTNLYYTLFNIDHIYLEDISIDKTKIPLEIEQLKLHTFDEFKKFEFRNAPVGQMAISTFGRTRVTGVIDIEATGTKEEITYWIKFICKAMLCADKLYHDYNISMLFFSEVFMEEYGGLYYSALEKEFNIIRFAGTVRDDSIVVQHLTNESDRTHFSSLTESSWKEILKQPTNIKMIDELNQNFDDRYSDKWGMSSRNQPDTNLMNLEDAKKFLNIDPNKNIAIIYSHILYDTLFFNGKDLFSCYAEWFIESVKAACKNPDVQWFVKVHPSNLWRGELEHYFGGEYEELRLIRKNIGELPDHVKMIYPDTPISPYTWLQLTDFGITTRGTSGIELGALGKTTITAGTGRYEQIGFTINPQTSDQYLEILDSLPNIQRLSRDQHKVAQKFAYASFCMKPYTINYLKPICRSGRSRIFSSDDLIYEGNFGEQVNELPKDLERFIEWSLDKNTVDFLNPWPS